MDKNMRDKYTVPEMEIIEFEAEDIITASGDSGSGGATSGPIELPVIKPDWE